MLANCDIFFSDNPVSANCASFEPLRMSYLNLQRRWGALLYRCDERFKAWLPDGFSQIFRSYVFSPSGFWTMAPLRYAAQFDPFLSLDCAPTPSTLAQSKERKGSNFQSGNHGRPSLKVTSSLKLLRLTLPQPQP